MACAKCERKRARQMGNYVPDAPHPTASGDFPGDTIIKWALPVGAVAAWWFLLRKKRGRR